MLERHRRRGTAVIVAERGGQARRIYRRLDFQYVGFQETLVGPWPHPIGRLPKDVPVLDQQNVAAPRRSLARTDPLALIRHREPRAALFPDPIGTLLP